MNTKRNKNRKAMGYLRELNGENGGELVRIQRGAVDKFMSLLDESDDESESDSVFLVPDDDGVTRCPQCGSEAILQDLAVRKDASCSVCEFSPWE